MFTRLLLPAFLSCLSALLHFGSSETYSLLNTRDARSGWGFTVNAALGKTKNGWIAGSSDYSVCDTTIHGADNWLVSPFLNTSRAEILNIEITYKQKDCKKQEGGLSGCQNDLELKYHPTDSEIKPTNITTVFMKNLGPISKPAGKKYLKSWEDTKSVWDYVAELNVSKYSGLYLALSDHGSCSMIKSVKLYFNSCPGIVISLARYKETPDPVDMRDRMVESLGCVSNAASDETPKAKCEAGNWKKLDGRSEWCQCEPGYSPNKNYTACIACSPNKYKSGRGNGVCHPCPPNSAARHTASTLCDCKDTFFRGKSDSENDPCKQAPNKPTLRRDPEVRNTEVTISWTSGGPVTTEPTDWYTVECQRCGGKRLHKVRGEVFKFTGLEPHTTYNVKIYAENSRTEGQRDIAANYADVQFTTGSKPSVGNLTAAQTETSKKISLQWDVVPATHNEFKVFVYRENQLEIVYTCQGTSYDLPTTRDGNYVFRVCFDDNDEICTEDLNVNVVGGEMLAVTPRNLVLGAAMVMGVVLVVLTLLLALLWCYKRGQTEWSQMPAYSAASMGHAATMPSIYAEMSRLPYSQAFVDPSHYEEPEKILFEFSREIFPEQIQFSKESDTEFEPTSEAANLQRATYHAASNQACAVLVKSVSEMDPGSLRAFAFEAGIMGQLFHPNVLMLHGVAVHGGNQLMMCIEYAAQGSLECLLRENPGLFTNMQLVHLLRGIACGMQYLSELGYVHKVLCSGNVLLTGSGVGKVAGFDTRVMLDLEEMTGAKPTLFSTLLLWLAPEVISHRKYSTHSDVYSFGVLMWELFSNCNPSPNPNASARTPYQNCSQNEAIKLVQNGHSLPPPVDCPPFLYDLMCHCWCQDPTQRPSFSHVRETLEHVIRHSGTLGESYEQYLTGLQEQYFRNNNTLAANQYLTAGSCKAATLRSVSPNSTIEHWLMNLKLVQYTPIFYSQNFALVKDLLGTNMEYLEQVGIASSKHRKKMVTSLNDIASRCCNSLKDNAAANSVI